MTRHRPALRLTFADVVAAFDEWGMNCGPAALCAVTGLSAAEIRPHLGDFEARHYMSPTMVARAAKSLGLTYREVYRREEPGVPPSPSLALVRVQWDGPWMRPKVPVQARYGRTHWIAQASDEIFDVNAMDIGGWMPYRVWTDRLAPLIAHEVPKASGKWWFTHVWEIL